MQRTSILHVAALPFPSSQGTQAALLAYVNASARDAASRNEEVGLLTYAEGDGRALLEPNVVHRRSFAPIANASLRSGPSLAKVAEDIILIRAIRGAHSPHIVAHHIEAGLACIAARRPFTWVMHTALGPELPLYAPTWPRLAPWLSHAGEALDAFVARRATRVLAVSPFLATRASDRFQREVDVLPIPWPIAQGATTEERVEARAQLGFEARDVVLLYAGNLDHYQGLEVALDALAIIVQAASDIRWLIATESDSSALRMQAASRGLSPHLVFTRLHGDLARRRAHLAADIALVPRRLEAGVSVKLLEAFAHALPTVAVRASTGGFAMDEAACVVSPDAHEFARATLSLIASPEARARLGAQGARYLRAHHTDAAMAWGLHPPDESRSFNHPIRQ